MAAEVSASGKGMTEIYVLVTISIYTILYPLACLRNRFPKKWINFLLWACYTLLPLTVVYNLGLIEDHGNSFAKGSGKFRVRYHVWFGLLLFALSGFDNLIAFKIEEAKQRLNLLYQFIIKLVLLLNLLWRFPLGNKFITSYLTVLFCSITVKFLERFGALSFATGASSAFKLNLSRMINYSFHCERDGEEADPVSMKGFKYLVGPRYSSIKEGKITDGITVEKIWECKGRLLTSAWDINGTFKDSCLSFALFWLILGKLRGYPNLYETDSSKIKARKLIFDGLGLGRGEHERVFRVIELELNFLHDYFYTCYIYYYYFCFAGKWVSSFLSMAFLWLAWGPMAVDQATVSVLITVGLMNVLFFMELIQLALAIGSRCFRVTLLCYYAKREMSSKAKCRFVDCCLEKVIGFICRASYNAGRFTRVSKPWKRELDQYSLLESCTCFGIDETSALQGLGMLVGMSPPKPGRKAGSSVVLSEHVKEAVIASLQTSGLKLSNGVASLRQNGVDEKLMRACKLDRKHSEAILVWHIATSICEMHPDSQGRLDVTRSLKEFKVATSLSKYCAYLLAFSPSLISIPLLEADAVCDAVIEEARRLLKKPSCSFWTTVGEVNKYEKLKELLGDEEEGEERASVLYSGLRLGEELMSVVEDEGRRWKILSEFWAEMILFSALSTSNSNEMVHAEKLADGGEFITHLWALLFHAGIVDRCHENL